MQRVGGLEAPCRSDVLIATARDSQFCWTRARATRQSPLVSIEPSWPIFCLDGADVIVVESAADLPIELDPVLADQPVTLVDASGRRLRKIVSQPQKKRHWWSIEYAPEIIGVEVIEGDDLSELLRQTLASYLKGSGVIIDESHDIESFARQAARSIR